VKKLRSMVTLTVFLMKEGMNESDCIEPELLSSLRSLAVSLRGRSLGTLYIRQTPTHPPQWAEFFGESAARSLFSSSVSAVYVTKAAQRIFALTFGYGRHLIRPGSYEGRFGLRATLNSVDSELIRAVDASTLEANPFYAKTQAAREAPLGDFGLDLDRDILRAITGRPTDPGLGVQMTGADALSVRVEATLEGLTKYLARYLEKSQQTHYRERFPWVDHVAEVRDPNEANKLNELLVEAIVEGGDAVVWAAIPEAIDWTGFDGFRFRSPTSGEVHDDVNLDRMLESLQGEPPSLEVLRKRRVYCAVQGESQPSKSWTYLECLIAEVPYGGMIYMLNAGTWHRVDTNFAEQVKSEVDQIPRSAIQLPDWGDESEATYNSRVSRDSQGRIELLDRKLIRHTGMASPIEFCDLLSIDRHVIHVKKYSQSSVLSHLFAQGLVSANCFLSDALFRERVNYHLGAGHKLPVVTARIDASEYEIVFAIGHSRASTFKLPFFSQVTLRSVYRTLTQSYGLRTGLVLIPISKLTAIAPSKIRRRARGGPQVRPSQPTRIIRI
jgi:uncharacterized protein (TIGR04141 family)